MNELLAKLSHHRVLVVGDAILDEYLSGDCSRLSPEAPVPVLRVNEVRQVLGGAANTAANVKSLGGEAVLMSIVGADWAGDALVKSVRAAGIMFEPLGDGRPTLRKTRVVGQRQQLVRLDYEEIGPIDRALEAQALERIRQVLPTCDIVVVSDYAKGLLTAVFCQNVIRLAHSLAKQVVVDPRPQHREFYVGCDYLTPNWKESLGLLGLPEVPQTPAQVAEIGPALTRAFGANVLLTLGADGMAFFGRDAADHFTVPTVAKEVFDVSGAGDTVVAAFALARAAGADHLAAVSLANQAAGIVVGKFGTATVTRAELVGDDKASGRLVPRGDLLTLSTTLRAKGKRVVTVNGSFDVLHAGHLHILREAKAQGDVLIVALNSDASVRSYKGPERPIFPASQRAEMLLGLRVVDYVHVFDEADPIAFLEQVRPDVHVNGAEYGENCVEAPTVTKFGGRLHLVRRLPDLSTSDVIRTLKTTD